MITVTAAAMVQINYSYQQGHCEPGMGLRIEAKQAEDGHIHYQMGFDSAQPGDQVIDGGGLMLLVSSASQRLVTGMTLDYIEMESNHYQFIFMNPNDPHFVAPQV